MTWAFANQKRDAATWLNSTHEERRRMFTPARLRSESDGRFLRRLRAPLRARRAPRTASHSAARERRPVSFSTVAGGPTAAQLADNRQHCHLGSGQRRRPAFGGVAASPKGLRGVGTQRPPVRLDYRAGRAGNVDSSSRDQAGCCPGPGSPAGTTWSSSLAGSGVAASGSCCGMLSAQGDGGAQHSADVPALPEVVRQHELSQV